MVGQEHDARPSDEGYPIKAFSKPLKSSLDSALFLRWLKGSINILDHQNHYPWGKLPIKSKRFLSVRLPHCQGPGNASNLSLALRQPARSGRVFPLPEGPTEISTSKWNLTLRYQFSDRIKVLTSSRVWFYNPSGGYNRRRGFVFFEWFPYQSP